MNDRHAIRLVVEREVRETLRRKALWITAALALVASTAIMVLPALIGSSDDEKQVAVVGEPGPTFSGAVEAAAGPAELDIELVDSADPAAARRAVADGDLDAALVLSDDPSSGDGTTLIVENRDSTLVTALRGALATDRSVTQLRAAGLDDDQIKAALSPPEVNLDVVDADRGGRIAAASAVSIAVYLLLFFVTMQVANGVAIEKSNRVSEVLLAIVAPRTLLLGKVIGVGLTALLPLVAGAIPVVIRLATSDALPPGTGSALGAAAAWFVLGGAFYLLAAGALGALVERQEDAGSSVAVLSVVLVASYVAGLSAPDTPIGVVLAYLPFSAPMVEPARLALGVSSPLEVTGSLLVCAVSVFLMARIATVVYQRAVVRTGSRLHLREVLGSRS